MERQPIDLEIDRVLSCLAKIKPETESYRMAVDNLEVLFKARSCKNSSSISADVIVAAATNLLGILLILNYERMDVISSKALSLILRPR